GGQPTATINLEEYTTSVTSYIEKCIDDVTVSKTITTHSNQKPWMTAKVRALLKSRDSNSESTVSFLNDYHPFGLTPIVMKCFKRHVMRHIKTHLPPSLDPLQFAYRPNHSMDSEGQMEGCGDGTHLDNKDTHVQMLFIDFSSAFNTIIPQHLIEKLSLLCLNISPSATGSWTS
ncbi:hypothetical protein QTP70_025401, partial [Hemibagrus guttatus]